MRLTTRFYNFNGSPRIAVFPYVPQPDYNVGYEFLRKPFISPGLLDDKADVTFFPGRSHDLSDARAPRGDFAKSILLAHKRFKSLYSVNHQHVRCTFFTGRFENSQQTVNETPVVSHGFRNEIDKMNLSSLQIRLSSRAI